MLIKHFLEAVLRQFTFLARDETLNEPQIVTVEAQRAQKDEADAVNDSSWLHVDRHVLRPTLLDFSLLNLACLHE